MRRTWIVGVIILLSGCTYTHKQIEPEPVMQQLVAPTPGAKWIPAKTQRVWVNPRIDETGARIDGHYKDVVIEQGHWSLQEMI